MSRIIEHKYRILEDYTRMTEHQEGRRLKKVYMSSHTTRLRILSLIYRQLKNLQVNPLYLHMNHIGEKKKNFQLRRGGGNIWSTWNEAKDHGLTSKGPREHWKRINSRKLTINITILIYLWSRICQIMRCRIKFTSWQII